MKTTIPIKSLAIAATLLLFSNMAAFSQTLSNAIFDDGLRWTENTNPGNFFDLTVGSNAISLQSIDTRLKTGLTNEPVYLFYKSGTYSGSAIQYGSTALAAAAGWSFLATTTTTTTSDGQLLNIDFIDITLSASTTYGFLIVTGGGDVDTLVNTNSNSDINNSDLALDFGKAYQFYPPNTPVSPTLDKNYLEFFTVGFNAGNDRDPAINVHYGVVPEPSSALLLSLGLAGVLVLRRRRQS